MSSEKRRKPSLDFEAADGNPAEKTPIKNVVTRDTGSICHRPTRSLHPANTGIPFVPPASGVSVRMYRTGLGDCFLLAFNGEDRQPRFMLIDCGVWKCTKGAAERMNRIMRHIADSTGNHLHVLVVTHEHWDHLSGFHQARTIFDEIKVDEVWMSWMENPADETANELRLERRSSIALLQAAVRLLDDTAQISLEQGSADARITCCEHIRMLLEFFGESPQLTTSQPMEGDFVGASTTADLMQIVRSRVRQPRYCRPGAEPLSVPGVPGVRIYVLGPPQDRNRLLKSTPSKGAAREVYATDVKQHVDSALYNAAELAFKASLSLEERDQVAISDPFDIRFRISPEVGQHLRFFKDRYGFGPEDQGASWRRIDTDWLDAAGQLALDLDTNTNNTSLVLAIEVCEGGPVLLFPGDAQVGNWLSWDDYNWSGVNAAELLRRTVLYKVGHHCSHNATLRERGLARMTSPALVALIPVDEKEARKPKGRLKSGWNMPYQPLLTALIEKTNGRVIRADTGLSLFEQGEKPRGMSGQEWQWLKERIAITELYAECRIGPGDV